MKYACSASLTIYASGAHLDKILASRHYIDKTGLLAIRIEDYDDQIRNVRSKLFEAEETSRIVQRLLTEAINEMKEIEKKSTQ